MREIKFRAWNKKSKNYLYEPQYTNFWLDMDGFDDGRFIFEQYTGLKDKNEKPIFEGDIVKVWQLEDGFEFSKPVVVEWQEETSSFHPGYISNTLNINYEYLIIGNVHESPELLEK